MSTDSEKVLPKWHVTFNFQKRHDIDLIDLKETEIFDHKYPVFKMVLAHELMATKKPNFFHVKRDAYDTEITDPKGQAIPMGSCVFIFGVSKDLGMVKALFFPQPEERLVLAGIDEVWITVLDKIDESQRLTVLTNLFASFVNNSEAWSIVYLIY
jgi:hypothetical protein